MGKVILKGVVGSHAYNLATENSDVDKMQVTVDPLSKTLGLPRNEKSKHQQGENDLVIHEVGKFCSLALAANPNVLEFLFLPEYEIITDEGRMLLDRKHLFLSSKIRTTFMGYAYGQFKKLENRGGENFSSDTRLRTTKHARHLFRLLKQGGEALETGTLRISLTNEEASGIRLLASLSTTEITDAFKQEYNKVKNVESCLPEEPDYDHIDETLATIRLMQGITNP